MWCALCVTPVPTVYEQEIDFVDSFRLTWTICTVIPTLSGCGGANEMVGRWSALQEMHIWKSLWCWEMPSCRGDEGLLGSCSAGWFCCLEHSWGLSSFSSIINNSKFICLTKWQSRKETVLNRGNINPRQQNEWRFSPDESCKRKICVLWLPDLEKWFPGNAAKLLNCFFVWCIFDDNVYYKCFLYLICTFSCVNLRFCSRCLHLRSLTSPFPLQTELQICGAMLKLL